MHVISLRFSSLCLPPCCASPRYARHHSAHVTFRVCAIFKWLRSSKQLLTAAAFLLEVRVRAIFESPVSFFSLVMCTLLDGMKVNADKKFSMVRV